MKKPVEILACASKTLEFTASDIKALMTKLKLNKHGFALLMNVTPMTVRLWTSSAVNPCDVSFRLMQIFTKMPDVINKLLDSDLE